VAIGAPFNKVNGQELGHVRIYQYIDSSWQQLGTDIDGEAEGDESGYSVSLSADGSTVAIGAPYNDFINWTDSGHVRVFQFTTTGLAGPQGLTGPEGPQGPAGADGLDGAGLVSATINADGKLILTLADGSQFDAGQVGDPNTTLSISKTTVLFGPAGGPTSVDVQSNTDWNWVSSDSSWIASAENSPLSGNKTFTFDIAPNTEPGSRSGTITFSSGPVSRSLAIIQEGTNFVFSIDKTLVEPGRDARVYNVQVRSSTDWVWESSQPWLTATEDTVQSGDQTFTFEVAENTTGVTREGTLTFLTTSGGYTLQLTVRQGPDPNPYWAQLGNDIDGDRASQSLGSDGDTALLSADGTRVLIYPDFDTPTRMYGLSSNNTWEQIGADLSDPNAGDYVSRIISISTDGNTVALVKGRVLFFYTWNGSSWDSLDASFIGEGLTAKISVSADTLTVAVGYPGNNDNGEGSGKAAVYRWNGSSWQQLGSDFNGEDLFDQTGSAVSISADGNSLAITTPGIDNNGAESGRVRFYTWNGSSWDPFAADFVGARSREAIVFSADSNTIAFRNKFYTWSGGSWDQVGQTDNVATGLGFSTSYSNGSSSLSADFSTIAVGYSNYAEGTGQVRVFRRNGNSWEQIDVPIDGEIVGDQFGTSVSLSADGRTIAIGAPGVNNSNGLNAGQVRVYRLTP
jgi:hypothetical protein